jgi:hypothetical protein
MKVEAYIRILGSEARIRALQSAVNVPDASIKETKAPVGGALNTRYWNWATKLVPINSENQDEELKALLLLYRPLFSTIRAQCDCDTDVYLEVITKYEPQEDPRGLFLSAETISLLSELGAAVDNDVYKCP